MGIRNGNINTEIVIECKTVKGRRTKEKWKIKQIRNAEIVTEWKTVKGRRNER